MSIQRLGSWGKTAAGLLEILHASIRVFEHLGSVWDWTENRAGNRGRRIADAPMRAIDATKRQEGVQVGFLELNVARKEKIGAAGQVVK